VSKGELWRVETERSTTPGKIAVMIYNGKQIYTNSNNKKAVENISDLRKIEQPLYQSLKEENYKGQQIINSLPCWYFVVEDSGVKIEIWIDSATHVLRKQIVRFPDGRVLTDEFSDFPISSFTESDLFNQKNLKVLLLKSNHPAK